MISIQTLQIAFTFVFAVVEHLEGRIILDLCSKSWQIRNTKLNISIEGVVPGSVHTALLSNHIIDDPYYGKHDSEYAWISDEEWSYEFSFSVSNDLLVQTSQLVFLGIDTVSTIRLNGVTLGKTENMFVRYVYDLKDLLKEKNILKMEFVSPTKYSFNQSQIYYNTYGYHVPPLTLPDVQHGRNHQNFIRKEQCSFSWDWGPSFPTIGIWKDVFIEFTKNAILEEFLIFVTPDKDMRNWHVQYDVIVKSYVEKEFTFLYGAPNNVTRKKIKLSVGTQRLTLGTDEVPSESIMLWWPNGYGKQKLYDAVVYMMDMNNLHSSSRKKKYGFRTVELVQEPIPSSEGLSFYFKINSRPIFLKGANWIPADAFQERVSSSVLDNLFQSSIDANINALRVWGGGIYEQDRFYELADELGIVIWQDLMFAVALYPVNDEFLESVQMEITTQVRRLLHHPSLIAWSGNNENEAAIAQTWWDEVKTNRKQLVDDYVKLYVGTIEPIIKKEDWTRPFMTSSPSNGPESTQSGYVSKNPQNPLYGDVHFYDYKNDCWNVSVFPNPRFASEYGYQSYPSYTTLSSVGSKDDLKWNSSLMYYRQHHANGNEEIKRFIEYHYNLPSAKDDHDYFRFMIYLSQIVQATCIKYESEHYRRLQGNLINGTGHTMGALYWQLNDIWQAPSWSSIEYGGRWKMLHYYVRHFFAPESISGYVEDGRLHVYYITDVQESVTTRRYLNVTAHSWITFDTISSNKIPIQNSGVASMEIFDAPMQTVCLQQQCFVRLKLYDEEETVISESDVFWTSFNRISLKDPNLRIKSVERIRNGYNITLNADCPAAFVWLETVLPGRFSENGFSMIIPSINVMFYSWQPSTTNMIMSTLKVISLYDTVADDT